MASRARPAFQCIRSDAPPALMRRCSMSPPRAAASRAISPGRSLRAVKLLPMKRTLSTAMCHIWLVSGNGLQTTASIVA